jgi:hypothetical protein
LKNEFELSDREVVLRSHARGMSIKYARIHEQRMSYLLANHPFSWRSIGAMIAFHRISNSSPVFEPYTHL